MRALSTTEPTNPPVSDSVALSRAERRAAARGKRPAESPRPAGLPGRGRNVIHDRSRYAVRRRG